MKSRTVWLLAAVAFAAACGGSDTAAPTQTAPAVSSTANADGGTTGGKTGGTTTATAAALTGTIGSLTGACPALSFKLEGRVITTDAATSFADVKCADLKDGTRVGVRGEARSDGSILAKIVKPVLPPPALPPPPVVTEGTVSGLSGACPAITFTVAGKTFTTDAQTRFGDGGCAAVKNDAKAVVYSQATPSGGVKVLAVKVIPPPPPPPVVTEGTVSGLSGACPAITFTVAGKAFTTDVQTRFGDGGCAAVKNNAKVVVYSQATPTGGVKVLAVKVIPPPPPPPALAGEVTAVAGACPAITITVNGKTAVTSATTVFTGKACGDVKVGAKVAIYGTIATGATSVTATQVVLR
ncbi:MAG: hypothetical protein FJ363_11605 [Gemmatimonadetes bacterium]|nr:hypothetical protein [Gemmatimonadota bacterium]